jgi:GNAT superfamily N-acetyltransferase
MEVKIARTKADIDRISDVLRQLRPAFDKEQLAARIREQRKHGYQLAYVESSGDVLCVAGFVVGCKLAWGKHIYVDDLVTDERHRSRGAGALMIEWLKSYAKQNGCGQIHLDSGVSRFAAHRFYLHHGFDIASHHFSTTDLDG